MIRTLGGEAVLGGIGSSIVQNREFFYVLFGLGEQGYVGTTIQLDILEKYREKPNRRRGTIDNFRASFFRRYTEEDSDDNPPAYY